MGQSMGKFTSSFIAEDSVLGFSITGGAKKPRNAAGGGGRRDMAMESSIITESSIADDVSAVGFGGSNALQGRVVSKRDKDGVKRQVDKKQVPSPRSLGWNYGDDEENE